MSEAARTLRYAVPGGVFELALGLWLLFDARFSDHALIHDFDVGAAAVALLIAAAFPLGFMITNVAQQLRHMPGMYKLFPPSNDQEIASRWEQASTKPEAAVAAYFVDKAISDPALVVVRQRILAWLDMMNALRDTAVGLALSGLSVWIAFLLTNSGEVKRFVVVLAFLAIHVMLFAVLREGYERVTNNVNRYRDLILENPSWQEIRRTTP